MLQTESQKRLHFLQSFIGKEISGSPSPYMDWLKPVVISAAKGVLVFSYTVRKEMTNPYGILHGGVTAGIIDDLIGATVFTLGLTDRFSTINNTIDYFAPASAGDVIVGETAIIKQGKKIINLQCELMLPEKNRLIAKGYSNLINLG